MRLSHKIFVTTAVLILALAGVGTWSLLAISRLVDVNRAIATQSVPALRLGTSLREQLSGLTRTEDSAGPAASEVAQKVWNDRASRMAKDLGLLRTFLGTEEEQSQHQEALIAFATYRRLAAMEPPSPRSGASLRSARAPISIESWARPMAPSRTPSSRRGSSRRTPGAQCSGRSS